MQENETTQTILKQINYPQLNLIYGIKALYTKNQVWLSNTKNKKKLLIEYDPTNDQYLTQSYTMHRLGYTSSPKNECYIEQMIELVKTWAENNAH